MNAFLRWLRNLIPSPDAESREEMEFHIEQATEENLRLGMDPDVARREALKAFGGPDWQRERVKDERRTRWMEDLVRDLRFGARTLRRRPAFLVAAVLSLGLGIGATSVLVSVVDGVLIRALPFHDPGQLVSLWKFVPDWEGVEGLDYTADHIHYPFEDFRTLRESATSFSAVGAHQSSPAILTGGAEPEEIRVGRASQGFFDMLGSPPILGRSFSPEEVPPGAEVGANVVILGYEFWMSRYGGDEGVLNRPLVLDGVAHSIIGVLPPGLRIQSDLVATHENGGNPDTGLRDVWTPLSLRCGNCNEVLARMAPGQTLERAQTEAQGFLSAGPPGQQARVRPLKERMTEGFGSPLWILLGAALVLLLIACVNVAGLLLGEMAGRRREIALRSSLGADKARVLRQLLAESLLLGLLGTALGLLLAWGLMDLFLVLAPPLPRVDEIGIGPRVLLVSSAMGMATGLLFGIIPALRLSTASPSSSLTVRGRTLDSRTRLIQRGVVAVQMALTVVLLVSGGLLTRSLVSVLAVDPGFDTENLVTLDVVFPDSEGDRGAILRRMVEALQATPGISHAAVSNFVPFGGGTASSTFRFTQDGETVSATHWPRHVMPGYPEVMGIPLITGVGLAAGGGPDGSGAMLVSESLARRYWPDGSAVGQTARYNRQDLVIVGVVGDVRKTALGKPAEETFYVSAAQFPRRSMTLAARVRSDQEGLALAVREAIRSVDQQVILGDAQTMTFLRAESEADDRFRTVLILVFAAAATVLAAVGVFGVTARAVSSRNREMVIRMALGARKNRVMSEILRESLVTAGVGAGLGLFAALWTARFLAHFLYNVNNQDLPTYLMSFLFLGAVCFGAALVPASRISRRSLARTLQEESQ